MSYWKYKAFDQHKTVRMGLAKSKSFLKLALTLRQGGFQIIEATRITEKEYHTEKRFMALKSKFSSADEMQQTTVNTSRFIWCASLLRRGLNAVKAILRIK